MNIWQILLVQPLTNGLFLFYKIFFSNMGLAIIGFTVVLRILLIPLTMPSLRASQKIKELAPQIAKLKKKHKDDKAKFAQAQMELYKQKGVNPASGCLPQIIQVVILIALFGVFRDALSQNGKVIENINSLLWGPLKISINQPINTYFLGLDLTKPDLFKVNGLPFALPGVMLVLSALIQFLSSKMMSPIVQEEKKLATKTKEELDDVFAGTQQQMLYFFPLMTILIGYSFPSGLVLYWLIFSLFQLIQQYLVSGWGGLEPWIKRLNLIK